MCAYRRIPIPDGLIKSIEKIIETDVLGYKSITEYVKTAIREKLVIDSKTYNIDLNGGLSIV